MTFSLMSGKKRLREYLPGLIVSLLVLIAFILFVHFAKPNPPILR